MNIESQKSNKLKEFASSPALPTSDKPNVKSSAEHDETTNKAVEKNVRTIPFYEIYRYASPLDYLLLAVAIVFSLGQGGLYAFSNILFKGLSDALIEGQADYNAGVFNYTKFYSKAIHSVYNYAGFGVGIFFLGFIAMSCWHIVCERQIHKIRKNYFAAVIRQDMAWFDENKVGELTTKMSDGIDRIKDGSGDKVGFLCFCFAHFIGGMIISFTQTWKIALMMVVFVPVMGGLVAFVAKYVDANSKLEGQLYEEAGAAAEEAITGIRTVIGCNGQKYEIQKYDKRLKKAQKCGIRKGFFISLGTGWVYCLIFVSMGIAFWYGITLNLNKEITPGTVFAAFWAITTGTLAIGQAAPQLGVIVSARNAASSIFAVIDRDPEINCQSLEGVTLNAAEGNVEFKNIHFRYPTRPEIKVLNNVSFKVPAGKSVAIVGHSGCGKSTLVGLLLRYYDVESGQVQIDGVNISQLNLQWLRTTVGIVSQEPVLFAATVAENLRLGKVDITDEEMEKICRMANAHGFISELPEKYNTRIGEGGVQLSGGQKQRIAIARALARDPKILLLDEATSALDTESEQIVQHAIEKARAGRTTITIAHRLSTIRNADNIIVFDHGTIVEQGTHEELLMLGGTYLQLVQAQEIEKATRKQNALEENRQEVEPTGNNFIRSSGSLSIGSSESSRRSKKMTRAMTGSSADDQTIAELREKCESSKTKPSGLLDIIRFANKEWVLLSFALLASILKGIVFAIFAAIYGYMFKALSSINDDDKRHGGKRTCIYYVALGVAAGLSTFFGGYLFSIAGEKLTHRLRLTLYSHIMKQDGEYFDSLDHASGNLTTRLATDAPNIKAAIDQRLSDAIQALAGLLSGVGLAFYFGPKMAPIEILTAVALTSVQVLTEHCLKIRTAKDSKLAKEPSRLSTEVIQYHKTVQYLTREDFFNDKFNELMYPVHVRSLLRGFIHAFSYALFTPFEFFNFAIAYRYGIWLIKTGNSTPFIVFQVIEALNTAAMTLVTIGSYFPDYIKARFSAGLLLSMLQEQPKINGVGENGKKPEINGNICTKDLYFAYPTNRKHLVLKGVDFQALRGKTVAIVGPSGCGKSTIIQLLERLYNPLNGQIIFDSVEIREINVAHLRSQMALVGQEPILFNASVKKNIAYGLENVGMDEIIEAAKFANAHKFITEMTDGYETSVGEKGGKLSGGQKQRIAIARAMIRKPKILLLDEATSALDSESEKLVQEALDRARNGRTCVVIAHRLSSIQSSDLIVVMKKGEIIEQGTHQELLQSEGLYANLIKQQDLN